MRPRGVDVGEHTTGTAEHVILYLDAFVNRNVVLDTDPVAYLDIVADVDILAKRATLTDHGTRLDMSEMPYLGAFAYRDIVIDIAAFVYIIVAHHSVKLAKTSAI